MTFTQAISSDRLAWAPSADAHVVLNFVLIQAMCSQAASIRPEVMFGIHRAVIGH